MHVKATDVAAPDRVAPDSRHMFDCEDSLTRTIFAGAGDSFDVEREHPGAGAPVDVIRKPTRNRAAAKPDTDVLIRLIKNREAVHFWAGECARYMVNVLEPVTSSEVPAVAHTLRVVREGAGADHVMMSGSGPTVFAWYAEPESGAGERNFLSLINALGKGYDVIFANLL
jgi:hypothetical protein